MGRKVLHSHPHIFYLAVPRSSGRPRDTRGTSPACAQAHVLRPVYRQVELPLLSLAWVYSYYKITA
jgi:hypothetical protein